MKITSTLEDLFTLSLQKCLKSRTKNHKSTHFKKLRTVLLIDNLGLSHYTSYLAYGISNWIGINIILYGFSMESFVVTGAAREKRISFYEIKRKLPAGDSILNTVFRPLFCFMILVQALTKSRYDIVHIQGRLPMFFLFIPLLKLLGKKVCWTIHDANSLPYSKGIRGIAGVMFETAISQPDALAKYSDKIIVHAYSLKKHLESNGVRSDKIHVVRHFDYNYLLKHEVQSIRESSDPPPLNDYVLFFGDIAPWKGVDTLINAARVVKKQIGAERFKVLIAGKAVGQELEYSNSLTNDDHKYIHFLNKYITNNEIPDLIRNARFLVLPYSGAFYSVSGVIPLAYTFSKPVVISNVESLAEYVEHDKTGLIFNCGDSKQLANCMIELLEDSSRCCEMGKNGHQKMIREMSLESYCEALKNLYKIN